MYIYFLPYGITRDYTKTLTRDLWSSALNIRPVVPPSPRPPSLWRRRAGVGVALVQVEGGVGLRSRRPRRRASLPLHFVALCVTYGGKQGLPITTISLSCSIKKGSSQQQGHDRLVSLWSSRGPLIGLKQKIKRMVSYFRPVMTANCLHIHGPYSIMRQFLIPEKSNLFSSRGCFSEPYGIHPPSPASILICPSPPLCEGREGPLPSFLISLTTPPPEAEGVISFH